MSDPAVRAAPGDPGLEAPDRLPGGCIQRHDIVARSDRIQNAPGDEWLCLGAARTLTRLVGPRDLQPTDSGAVDLGQAGISDPVRASPVTGPLPPALHLLSGYAPCRCGPSLRCHLPGSE